MKTSSNIAAVERLQQCSIKPSLQRIAIMNYMMKHYTHPNIDEVFNALYPVIPTLSKTTVYSTLKLFAQQGAVTEINIDEKNVRYDGDTLPHAHFKCKHCGTVYDLPLKPAQTDFAKRRNGFVIDEQQIYYKGYCKKCQG
ncbi:transcriptional repressor [Bacteroidia bacterium]|nr:transcriptional repressor [Bacteroidia bacterium]